MALEAGIAALKMLYQLAKMIKEARDNVIFVREKLESTLSIEKIIEISVSRLDEEAPEAIMKEIQKRLAIARRTARRMRMKYDPLVALLNSLGGGAAVVKAQAAAMRRGVLGASMALGTLSVMVRGHIERVDERARKTFERSMQSVGVLISVDAILNGDDIQEELDRALASVNLAAAEVSQRMNDELQRTKAEANAAATRAQTKALAQAESAQAKANDMSNYAMSRATEAKSRAMSELDNAQAKAEGMANDAVSKGRAKVNATMMDAQSKVDGAVGGAAAKAKSAASSNIGNAQTKMNDTVNGLKGKAGQAGVMANGALSQAQQASHAANGVLSQAQQVKVAANGAMSQAQEFGAATGSSSYDLPEGVYEDDDFELDGTDEAINQARRLGEGGLNKAISQTNRGQKAANAAMEQGGRALSRGSDRMQSYANDMTDDAFLQGQELSGSLARSASDSISLASSKVNKGKAQGLQMAADLERGAASSQARANDMVNSGKKKAQRFANDAQNKANEMAVDAQNQVTTLVQSQYDSMSEFFTSKGQEMIGAGLGDAKSVIMSQLKVLQKAVDTCKRVYDMLDDLDGLVNELKSLEKKAVDEDDSDTSNAASDSKAAAVVPVRKDKHGNVIPPKERESGSFIKMGIKILMSSKIVKAGSQTVEDSDLKRVMGAGFNNARLKLIRRRVGDPENDGFISSERFEEWLATDCTGNVGIGIAAVACALLSKLQVESMPKIIQETAEIVQTMMKPLIDHALGFGILLQCEEMREAYKEDPDEIAALQAEADEEALANRMSLIKAFAVDFKEAFEYGFSPDPALMISIAIEAGTSFIGLGPTTRRRLELLYAIMSICNIEADKVAIEKVEYDLKSELQLLQSLGHGSSHDRVDTIHEHLNSTFDARKVLGANDTADFWVSSFGKDTFEVSWTRFRVAFSESYGRMTDKESKRLQMLLLDNKGNVTLDHVKAFIKAANGSLELAVISLGKAKAMPRNLVEAGTPAAGKALAKVVEVEDGDVLSKRPLTAGLTAGGSTPAMSPTEKRMARLRLYGVVQATG